MVTKNSNYKITCEGTQQLGYSHKKNHINIFLHNKYWNQKLKMYLTLGSDHHSFRHLLIHIFIMDNLSFKSESKGQG